MNRRSGFGEASDFAVKIPPRLFEVFERFAFVVGPPDVLHGVAAIEVHPLGDRDAFDAGGVGGVVRRVIDVIHNLRRTGPICFKWVV